MTARVQIMTATGSDVVAFIANILADIEFLFGNTTTVTVEGVNGDTLTLRGTGLTYDALGNVTGGTVTRMYLTEEGSAFATYAEVTGLSLDAALTASTLLTGTAEDVLALFGPIEFIGNDGVDIAQGANLGDSLSGGLAADELDGNGGNDLIEGGAGADILRGGTGFDTLSYESSLSRVIVDLQAGSASGGDAAGDDFTSFENLLGSDLNDRLTGSSTRNTIEGGAGADIISGMAGADSIFGGSGNDQASYERSNAGVRVDLLAETASGGHAQGDTLDGIENLGGSKFTDQLTGNNQVNVLYGLAGNDVLDGGVNNDRLYGGTGADRLIGGQGIDKLFGGAAADVFQLDNAASSRDLIGDYAAGVDSLEIEAALFGGGLAAGVALTAGQLVVNATGLAGDANDRFILNSATGELFFDINGSTGGVSGSRLVAVLEGSLGGFSVADFDIV